MYPFCEINRRNFSNLFHQIFLSSNHVAISPFAGEREIIIFQLDAFLFIAPNYELLSRFCFHLGSYRVPPLPIFPLFRERCVNEFDLEKGKITGGAEDGGEKKLGGMDN